MAPEPERVARLGPTATVTETSRRRRRRQRLLIVSIRVGALRQLRRMVQVCGLLGRIAVPFGRETKRRSAEKAPALPGAARAGVGAGGGGAVDTVSHSPGRGGGGQRLLPLAVASAENWQTGDKSGPTRT